jgi:hypothetical protein
VLSIGLLILCSFKTSVENVRCVTIM